MSKHNFVPTYTPGDYECNGCGAWTTYVISAAAANEKHGECPETGEHVSEGTRRRFPSGATCKLKPGGGLTDLRVTLKPGGGLR